MNPRPTPESIAASAQRVRASGRAPTVAVVLGSGWDGIAETVDAPLDIAYAELPAFPVLGVAAMPACCAPGGSAAARCAGAGRPQARLRDRRGRGMKGAIRTLAALGVRQLLVQTNAAGSADERMRPGELMLITDHLNLSQRSPLFGEPATTASST
jgi:purine-nucleoside phosphorylase